MAVSAQISITAAGRQTTALDAGTATFPFSTGGTVTYTDGTGDSQVDRLFTDTRTLAASATENLDLAGVLTDAYGAVLTFAKVKAVIITAASGNTNSVQFTRPASNGVPVFMAAGDGISLGPGGMFAFALPGTGFTVTAATGDILTVTNSAAGTPVTYTVTILGTSV